MDSQRDRYFTDLLEDESNFNEYCGMESQLLNQNIQVSFPGAQFTTELESFSKKPPRSGNFTPEEDKLLVSAWLNISMDAVHGTDQKRSTYWQRVWEFFQEHKTFDSNRSESSLMNRWSSIQLAVNKFCGCYAQVVSLRQSGSNEDDKISKAKAMYKEFKKSSFQFEHCWHMLRSQPKWLMEFEKKNQSKRPKISTHSSPSTPEATNVEDNNISPDNFVHLERPIGMKAEKERLKRKKNNESANDVMARIMNEIKEDKRKIIEKKMEILDKVYAQEQEKIRIKQEKLEVEQFKEDERIIMMDLSGLSKTQQEFYRARQTKILEKRKGE